MENHRTMGNQLAPFRSGTRQKFYKAGSLAYNANSTVVQEFPRVGMLSAIIVQFRGTVTYSAAGTPTADGLSALASRFRLNTNIGAAQVIDLSGPGAYMWQRLNEFAFDPSIAGVGTTTPNADIYAFPASGAAQPMQMSWILPVGANDGFNFDSGLINLQAAETRVQLEIVTGAITDISTNVTGIAGNWHVGYVYYEIPDPSVFALPPLVLCRTLEENQVVGATGDVVYTVPRGGTLLQLVQRLTLNGAPSDAFDSIAVKFNKTDSVYQIERGFQRVLERMRYGVAPITGVVYHDLWHAYGDVSTGDTRDAIDTEQLSTLEAIVTVSAGATLGSNNNSLKSIRRIIQVVQQ